MVLMKAETVRAVTGRIAQMEAQEKRLALLIQFPPPGCRNVAVWRQMQGNTLLSLRQLLAAQRESLALLSGQLVLPLI